MDSLLVDGRSKSTSPGSSGMSIDTKDNGVCGPGDEQCCGLEWIDEHTSEAGSIRSAVKNQGGVGRAKRHR